MPTKFNTSNDSYRVDLNPQIPIEEAMPDEVQPSAISQAMSATNSDGTNSAAAAFNSLFGGPGEEEILGQYAAEGTGIVGETAGYATERERLLQGLASVDPKDRKSIEGYYKQLASLRAGERQGASGLSPSVAATRINNLTKSYLIRFPQYSEKIRKLHAGIIGDIDDVSGVKGGSGGAGADPDVQAMQELTKNAFMKGVSVQEEIGIANAKALADIQQMDVDAKARLGKLTQPDVSASVLSYANVFYKDQMPGISEAIKNPNFSGKEIVGQLHVLIGTIKSAVNQNLADIQVQNKLIFEDGFQEKLLAQAVGPLEELVKMADKVDNPRDRALLSDNLRKIAQNSDIATLRKRFGPWTTYLQGTPDLVGFAVNAEETMNKIKKGLLPTVRKLAETDVNTRLTLQYLESPEGAQYMADVVLKMNQGKDPEPTGSALLDKVGLQGALDASVAPTTNLDTSLKMLTTAARSPHIFEAMDRRNDIVKRSQGVPEIVNTLKGTSAKLLIESASKSSDIDKISFDVLNPTKPFTIGTAAPPKYTDFGSGMRVPGGLYGEGLTYSDSPTHELVDRLNQQYRVFSKLLPRPEVQKWMATTMDELKSYSVNARSSPDKYLESKITPQTPSPELSPEETALIIEAKQAGMTPAEYKVWINTPAK